jgi:outer membrane protein assembly factor BamB
MDTGTGVVLIDLGYQRGEPPSYRSRGRDTMPAWWPVGFLAVVVLLLAGASAGPAKSPVDMVLRVPMGPADTFALTGDGELLAQTYGLLTAYELDSGRVRWQAGQSTPAYRLRLGDGLLLMRPWRVGTVEPDTTAVSLRNGTAQWERPGTVVTVAGSSVLLAVRSARSLAGTGRRVQGPIEAVDAATGRTRWTVPVPNTAVLLGLPGVADEGPRMLLMHDDRTLAVHDLETGRLLARTEVPPADYSPENPTVAGGMILLRHPGHWGADLVAYDPVLRRRWTAPAGSVYQVDRCGALACLSGPDGVRAIDPGTGTTRWSRAGWGSVGPFGAGYVAYRAPDHIEPVTVFDPADGDTEVDLRGWRPVPAVGAAADLLLVRAIGDGGRTMVAVARPGERRPRPLAALPPGTGDCQAVPGRLVCRSASGELVVWAYRKG